MILRPFHHQHAQPQSQTRVDGVLQLALLSEVPPACRDDGTFSFAKSFLVNLAFILPQQPNQVKPNS